LLIDCDLKLRFDLTVSQSNYPSIDMSEGEPMRVPQEFPGALPRCFNPNTQAENQRTIEHFQHLVDRARKLQSEQYPPNTTGYPEIRDYDDPAQNKEDEISFDLGNAESDLDSLKNRYQRLQALNGTPGGYQEYLEQQRRFDHTAESLEQDVNEALEGLRDPQTVGGKTREVFRDARDGAADAWRWIQEASGN
jgi:hypothetical protein